MRSPAVLALMLLLLAGTVQAQDPCFSDTDWQALQRSTAADGEARPVLLYVWSPRMVLSAQHAAEVRQVAVDLGVDWLPVHDGRVPAGEIREAVQTLDVADRQALAQSQPLCARELIDADAWRHFPTAWLVQQGRADTRPLVSAMPPVYWRLGLQERLLPVTTTQNQEQHLP